MGRQKREKKRRKAILNIAQRKNLCQAGIFVKRRDL
jgi:hypothetical protein